MKWQRAFVRCDSQQRLLARRLVIDSDPRSAPKKFRTLDSQSILGLPSKGSGCGKNWASGYNLSRADEKRKGKSETCDRPAWNSSAKVPCEDLNLHERIMDGIRKEVEVCTGTPEFLIWHSLGGGVGGGVTSRVLEHLREIHPKNYIASASISSLGAGFDPMQKINSVMCLGWLQAYVDLPMLFQPEALANLHSKNSMSSRTPPDLDLVGLNEAIAQGVAGALWPLGVDETFGGKSRINDLVTGVCPDVRTKFTEVGSTMVSQMEGRPERNPWKRALFQIIDSFPKGCQEGKWKPEILGAMMSARSNSGRSKGSCEKMNKASDWKENLHAGTLANRFGEGLTLNSKQKKRENDLGVELKDQFTRAMRCDGEMLEFRQGSACVPPVQENGKKTWSGYRGGIHEAKSITVVANRSSFADYASKLAACGRSLCQTRAFLHWYEAHDVCKEAILEMIDRMEAVAVQYRIASLPH